MVFLRDQTFFDSQLKRTIFFLPDQNQTIFSQRCNRKQFFFLPFISFDFQHTILSFEGVITFTWTLYHLDF